jgi:hypothetical protein
LLLPVCLAVSAAYLPACTCMPGSAYLPRPKLACFHYSPCLHTYLFPCIALPDFTPTHRLGQPACSTCLAMPACMPPPTWSCLCLALPCLPCAASQYLPLRVCLPHAAFLAEPTSLLLSPCLQLAYAPPYHALRARLTMPAWLRLSSCLALPVFLRCLTSPCLPTWRCFPLSPCLLACLSLIASLVMHASTCLPYA